MGASVNLQFSLHETWEIQLDCLDAAGAPLDLTGTWK